MILAKNIRYLRRKNGWSLADLADRLGYKSFTTIHKWESGVNEPPLKTAHKLARIFNVDIDALVKVDLEVYGNPLHDAMADTTEQREQPTATVDDGLDEKKRQLIDLILQLPPDAVERLLKVAELILPPQTQETD